MGTRNLTCVVKDGEYKFAKYGQWDGYLESLGLEILKFLRDSFNREKFLAGLANTKVATDAELKQFWIDAGANPDDQWVNMAVSEKFNKVHPELGRDLSGAKLLEGIQAGTVKYSRPEPSFAADSLFCEWAYVVDLDKGTFEVYKGFNKSPLAATERFASVPLPDLKGRDKREYYQIRHVKTYSLRRLPSNKTFMRLNSIGNRWDKEWAASEKSTKVDAKASALVTA